MQMMHIPVDLNRISGRSRPNVTLCFSLQDGNTSV